MLTGTFKKNTTVFRSRTLWAKIKQNMSKRKVKMLSQAGSCFTMGRGIQFLSPTFLQICTFLLFICLFFDLFCIPQKSWYAQHTPKKTTAMMVSEDNPWSRPNHPPPETKRWRIWLKVGTLRSLYMEVWAPYKWPYEFNGCWNGSPKRWDR